MILVASLRFSGSHFTWRALSSGPIPWATAVPDAPIVKVHIDPTRCDQLLELIEGRKVVIPTRPVDKIWASWNRAGYSRELFDRCLEIRDELDGFRFDVTAPDFDGLEDFVGFEVYRATDPISHPNKAQIMGDADG